MYTVFYFLFEYLPDIYSIDNIFGDISAFKTFKTFLCQAKDVVGKKN